MAKILQAAVYAKMSGAGGYPEPAGKITITANGTGIDVKDYAEADVAVPNPSSGALNINANGTYDVTDKAQAVVAVPQPSGTKQITIAANGTITEDVEAYEDAEITVNVPNPSTGSLSITENGTYDVTDKAAAVVNVPAGSTDLDTVLDGTATSIESNATSLTAKALIDRSGLRELSLPECQYVYNQAMYISVTWGSHGGKLERLYLPKVLSFETQAFYGAGKESATEMVVTAPLCQTFGTSSFCLCAKLKKMLLTAPSATILMYAFSEAGLEEFDAQSLTIHSAAFANCSALVALILRSTAGASTLNDSGAFSGTPIASGTGYIYVPRALVDTYKAATNWSTYAAQFRALEDYTVDGTTTGALDPSKI